LRCAGLTQKTLATLMTDQVPAINQLLKNLDHVMPADRYRLRRQLLELRKKADGVFTTWSKR
jgi:ATP-dependent helicase HrpA